MSSWRRLAAAGREEWLALAAFVRRPVRTVRGRRPPTALRMVCVLALLLSVISVVDVTAVALLERFGIAYEWEHVEIDAALLIGVLLVAPTIEELLFRAGLRRLFYTLFAGPPIVVAFVGSTVAALGLAALMAALSLIVWETLKRDLRAVPGAGVRISRRFLAHYPVVVWIYSAAFAAAHLQSWTFPNGPSLLALPLVVAPYFVFGVLASYARLSIGLRAAVALHLAANGLFLLLNWTFP